MQEGALQEPAAAKRSPGSAVLIANPTSGGYIYHAQQLKDTVTFLRAQGWQVDLKLTQAAGDARRLAQEAVDQRVAMVVVAGGDGTINEVIQALAGSETALGVLPGGTVNVWAREVGIPLDIAGAREVLIHGQIRSIDLGRVNERYFLLMAGIGLDGEVTHAIERQPVKRLGLIAYLFVGAWLGLGYPAFRALLQVDGETIRPMRYRLSSAIRSSMPAHSSTPGRQWLTMACSMFASSISAACSGASSSFWISCVASTGSAGYVMNAVSN